MKYQIESRISDKFKWRKVTTRPHDERMPFNCLHQLQWDTWEEAEKALAVISHSNDGEYRVIATNPAFVQCDCGSRDTVYTGIEIYQDADASRGLDMMEGDEVYCNHCKRMFWY